VLTGSSTPVSITFATDDGNPASALAVTSGLSALPAGWSSTSAAFTCTTVSAGTPCALALTYAPTTVGNGTLSIGFSYVNDAGFPGNGTVNITYRANSNDTVGGTSAPNPLVVAATTTQNVVVTFVTSDGNPASGLSVTAGLTALPGDWAGPASFGCTTVSAGTPCQLTLSYQPLVPESGSITLAYTYTNNAGLSEQGTVSIPYSSN
jgi:hypothetical protein